jgi:hypothetical protein
VIPCNPAVLGGGTRAQEQQQQHKDVHVLEYGRIRQKLLWEIYGKNCK